MISTSAFATNYQSFSEFSYTNNDYTSGFSFDTEYFLAPQGMIGVLDQFGYLNTDSNFGLSVDNLYDETSWVVNGEYFLPNNLFVMGALAKSGDTDANVLGLGYLVNDDLKVGVYRQDADYSDASVHAFASYNYQINDIDFIAGTIDVDDEFDTISLDGEYFAKIGNDRFVRVFAAHINGEHWKASSIDAHYYLNPAISVGVGVTDTTDEDASFNVSAKMYFDTNFAAKIAYSEESSEWNFSVVGQF